eukprot:gb/GECH01008730.1/.p1 GENE.gb/GECH01008730.1/~~gb/GECH01008730.1/.p1  ORF type:complete len:560 (+),score=112.59 gb/GECH01008730.1/:1-1680(+)
MAEEEEWRTPFVFLVFGLLVFTSFLVGKLLHRYQVHFLSESGATMLIGLVAGFIDSFIFRQGFSKAVQFDTATFNHFVLPAIIFQSGYALKKRGLFQNLTTIITYAIIGTLINCMSTGFALWGFAKVGMEGIDATTPVEAIVFAACISAIDPVSTIALFSEVFQLDKRMEAPLVHNLVFGESVLNDAVCIVLFRIFSGFLGAGSFGTSDFFVAMGMFVYIFVGSIFVAAVIGLLSAIIFKYISFRDDNAFEVLSMIILAFTAYLTAEALGLSGIVSLFFCGIIMGHYTWYNVSPYSKLTTPQTFRLFSTLADTYVFLYLGLATFSFYDTLVWNWPFIFITLGLCLICRAFNIFPLTFVANRWRSEKIPFKVQLFLWSSGLRGAIAFALALELHASGMSDNSPSIISCTLFACIVTTILIGGSAYPLLNLMGLMPKENSPEDFKQLAVLMVNRQQMTPRPITTGAGKKADKFWKDIEHNYMRPLFRREDDTGLTSYLRTILLGGSVAHNLEIGEIPQHTPEHVELKDLAVRVTSSRNLAEKDTGGDEDIEHGATELDNTL